MAQRSESAELESSGQQSLAEPKRRSSRWWLLFAGVVVSVPLLALYVSRPGATPPVTACAEPSLQVHKREGVVELYCAGTLRGRFLATFGQNPVGPKLRQGDERTPEGRYQIVSRVQTPRFHRFLGVSYPNAADLRRAKELAITQPGNGIGIHGVKEPLARVARLWLRAGHALGLNRLWGPTDGCIGVSNEDIDAIYAAVRVGTPLEITP